MASIQCFFSSQSFWKRGSLRNGSQAAASAARIFGWDKPLSGAAVQFNQLCITQEQLEHIRQLREPVAYEAPQPETSPRPFEPEAIYNCD